MSTKLDTFTEFETKYRVEGDVQYKFKALMSEQDYKDFIYAEGPDFYYTRPNGSFIRYRKAFTEKRSEITIKEKPEGAKSNLIRKEINWRVDHNSKDLIEAGAEMMGYTFNFSIHKQCHIYKMKDGTNIVFYSVRGMDNKMEHFIEIELNEDKVHELTKEEALDTIRKYEEMLSPIGITHRNRMNKSLFELYYKGVA